jgi:hypothetical protein
MSWEATKISRHAVCGIALLSLEPLGYNSIPRNFIALIHELALKSKTEYKKGIESRGALYIYRQPKQSQEKEYSYKYFGCR